jgi:hypothetical protein
VGDIVSDPEADREVRKQIAQDAAVEKAAGPTIFTRAFQFFLVPMIIVLACVGVYWFFTYTMTGKRTPQDWAEELKQSGPNARKHAAAQIVAELRRLKPEERASTRLYPPLMQIFEQTGANEPSGPAPLVGEGPPLRALVAECLGLLGDARAAPVLIEAVRDEKNPQTIASLISAAGALRNREVAPDLIKLLDHPSSVVRKYAAFTLGAIAAPDKKKDEPKLLSAVEPLKAKLNDSRPEVQWNAAFALAFFLRDGSGAPVLRRMLDRQYITDIVNSSCNEPGGVGEQTKASAPGLIAHALMMACQGVAALRDPDAVNAAPDPTIADRVRLLAEKDPDPRVVDAAKKTIHVLEKKN